MSGRVRPQDDDADRLRQELDDDPDDDERGDDVRQPEQAEEDGGAAEHQQRHVREGVLRVDARERREIVAVYAAAYGTRE